MNSDTWTRVSNEEQFQDLLRLALDFHDAVSRISQWVGAEYLNPSRHLVLDGFGDLTISTISQFAEVPDLELRFAKVRHFRYGYENEFDPEIEFTQSCVRISFLEWQIEAESIQYRKSGSRFFGPPELE